MKVAQVVCTFPPYKGGMGNAAYYFSLALGKQGHEVTVFTPDYGQGRAKKSNYFKMTALRPLLSMGKGAFIPRLLKHLNAFDIVHLHYPFFGGAEVVWLAKILFPRRFKLVIHYHMDVAGLPLFIKIFSWPSKLIMNSLFRRADAIICASLDYIKHSSIGAIYRKHPDKFYEIPFGVDGKKFKPSGKTSIIRAAPAIILFVGGLDKAHYFKGINILFKAISKLKIKNYKLKIVGDGDLRPKYENLAKKLDLTDKIKFLGKVSDEELPRVYDEADLFVLPSINSHEAFGLVLLEAMASGVPVIASNLPGVRGVFQDGVQGLLAEPGRADDLRDKIEQILGHDERRKQMSLAGRKLVEEKYNWERVRDRLNEVYEL